METTQFKEELLELGILTSLAGYRCLTLAIPKYHEDPSQSFTKELYPAVGHLCTPELSGAQVEKLIRYAIDTAWQNRDEEIWRQYFQQDRKPTNGEFISRISEMVEMKNK